MKCQEVQELAFEYLNHEISPEKRRQMLAHLAVCEKCRLEVDKVDHLEYRIRRALQTYVLRNSPPTSTWTRWRGILSQGAGTFKTRKTAECRRSPPPKGKVYGSQWLAPATLLVFTLVFMAVSQVFNAFNPILAPYGYTTDRGTVTLSGERVRMQAIGDLQAAEAEIGFPLKAPPDLPDGYALREVHMAGQNQAFLFYSGPGHDIIVSQAVLRNAGGQPDEFASIEQSVLINGRTESVLIDGRPASWEEQYRLAWRDDRVHYTVAGLGLGLEQATAIARTLK